MKWLRLYHDTPNDPKWRLVAVESGQPVANVLAVWTHMMVNASEANDRGRLENWNDRIVGAALDIRGDAVAAIREAMQGVVLDGDVLTGWEKRQRQGSDDAAARKAKSRAKQPQNPPPDDENHGHGANGADRDMSQTVTGQSRDKPEMSRDNGSVSRDRHVTPSARDRLQITEESTTYVDSEKPSPAPRGAGGGPVAYSGVSFKLGEQKFAELKARYYAIPDFLAAIKTLDADLVGTDPKAVYAQLQRRLNGMHQREMSYRAQREAKKQPPRVSNAGKIVLGGGRR
jgi:hypothetical protein